MTDIITHISKIEGFDDDENKIYHVVVGTDNCLPTEQIMDRVIEVFKQNKFKSKFIITTSIVKIFGDNTKKLKEGFND